MAAVAPPLRIGLIDSGVQANHASIAGVDVRSWGCNGTRHPDAHCTAVASLLVGYRGVAGSATRGRHKARDKLTCPFFAVDRFRLGQVMLPARDIRSRPPPSAGTCPQSRKRDQRPLSSGRETSIAPWRPL